MYLRSLHLHHFRNYMEQRVQFLAPKTILVGDNAQGKSNLLEAVELLATLGSHRSGRDRELVLQGQEAGRVSATIERLGVDHDLALSLRASGRRTARVNGQVLSRQLDFLGQVNAVLFSSTDLELVRGAPECRRQWLDGVLLQLEPVYSHIMEDYRRVLRQRNALIKQESTGATVRDPSQLQVWNDQLTTTGLRVMRRRIRLLARLEPLAHHWHQQISGGREDLELVYQPQVPVIEDDIAQLQSAFVDQLALKAALESARGTSLVGPHRDEVELRLNGIPARIYGSQGQQRTLVLALKLAELELIEQVVGDPPLLLLDDVLAELDLHRQNQLLDAIQTRVQTLVTATHLNSFDARWLSSAHILTVRQGSLQSSSD